MTASALKPSYFDSKSQFGSLNGKRRFWSAMGWNCKDINTFRIPGRSEFEPRRSWLSRFRPGIQWFKALRENDDHSLHAQIIVKETPVRVRPWFRKGDAEPRGT